MEQFCPLQFTPATQTQPTPTTHHPLPCHCHWVYLGYQLCSVLSAYLLSDPRAWIISPLINNGAHLHGLINQNSASLCLTHVTAIPDPASGHPKQVIAQASFLQARFRIRTGTPATENNWNCFVRLSWVFTHMYSFTPFTFETELNGLSSPLSYRPKGYALENIPRSTTDHLNPTK